MSLYEIFLACGAKVSTDSRKVEPGSLFVALRGERFDGNLWAAAALEAGAAAVVVDRKFADEQAAGGTSSEHAASGGVAQDTRSDTDIAHDSRYVVVDDTLAALQQLAAHHRRMLGITILAITGTNGKTTTKELTAAVLSKKFTTRATQGNLNNHIGVPLTLLKMRAGELGIVEMGASARGEIAALCDIASPDMGLITNVGRAHLEGFGGEEGVRHAKGELYDYLAAHGGTAFVRNGDAALMEMAAQRKTLKIIAYPAAEGFASQLVGDYNAHNVAAAVAVGRQFGVPNDAIRAAIAEYVPTNNRSQRVHTGRNALTVDCYNANPSSMAAALSSFGGDTAILGDMAELGAFSAEEHLRVLRAAIERGVSHLMLVGEYFESAHGVPGKVHSEHACTGLESGAGVAGDDTVGAVIELFPNTDALIRSLREKPITGREILIKGSRSAGLEKVLEVL